MKGGGERLIHYDEHTIELFLLGSEKVLSQHAEIEQHLKDCFSCREIAEELAQFHGMLNGSQPQLKEHVEIERANSLELRPEYVRLRNSAPLIPVIRSIPSRFWRAAKQRPIVTTCSGIAVLALVITLFRVTTSTGGSEPAYTRMNESQGTLEVYNQKDDKMWQLPSNFVKATKHVEETTSATFACVSDIYGNGHTEVITTLMLPSEDQTGSTLKVYDAERTLTGQLLPQVLSVNYKGAHYESPYVYESLAVETLADSKAKNILVAANNGRSPWFLLRLNAQLKPIGRYWHFGGIFGVRPIDFAGSGTKELLVWGVDQDGALEKESTRAFAAILDPTKIEGDKEASATKGFGIPTSEADAYYIRFPESDIQKLLGARPRVGLFSSPRESNLRFVFTSETKDNQPQFDFFISRDFHVLDVKPSSATIAMHAELRKKGKIKSTLEEDLKELGRSVQYWNGVSWSYEWTSVKAAPAVK